MGNRPSTTYATLWKDSIGSRSRVRSENKVYSTQFNLTWLNFFPQDSRKRRKPSFWPCVEVTPQNGKPLLSLKDFMAEDIIILILLYIHDYIFLPHHMHYANAFWMQGILLLYALNPKYLNWEFLPLFRYFLNAKFKIFLQFMKIFQFFDHFNTYFPKVVEAKVIKAFVSDFM